MSVLNLLSDLRVESRPDQRRALISSLREVLEDNPQQFCTAVRVRIQSVLRWLLEDLHDNKDQEFYSINTHAYEDDDGSMKVAVFIAFIQQFDKHSDNLEQSVEDRVVEWVKDNQLESVVNDICVNTRQVRLS